MTTQAQIAAALRDLVESVEVKAPETMEIEIWDSLEAAKRVLAQADALAVPPPPLRRPESRGAGSSRRFFQGEEGWSIGDPSAPRSALLATPQTDGSISICVQDENVIQGELEPVSAVFRLTIAEARALAAWLAALALQGESGTPLEEEGR